MEIKAVSVSTDYTKKLISKVKLVKILEVIIEHSGITLLIAVDESAKEVDLIYMADKFPVEYISSPFQIEDYIGSVELKTISYGDKYENTFAVFAKVDTSSIK